MNRNFISILLVAFMVFGSSFVIQAQDDTPDPMWRTILLTPDNKNRKTLGENMRAHNQKYHGDGPYKSTVYNITTGPNFGKMVWMMGPLTFTDLDSQPRDGYTENVQANILPYIEDMTHGEFWEGDMKLSNTAMMDGDASKYPIVFVRYWKVNIDHMHNAEHMLKMISEAVKAMEGENPWGVYYNLFRQGDMGRHIATVGFSKNWAEYDDDPTFKAAFDKVHGKDAWEPWIRNMQLTFDDSWDEIWIYNKSLSGD